MLIQCSNLLANFTVPYETGNGPMSLLWLLPLLGAIAIIWKTLKVPSAAAGKLIKEVIILFGTLVICYAGIALAIYVVGALIIGR